MTVERPTTDISSWAAIALLVLLLALLEWRAPLPIAPESLASPALACAVLGAVALFYRQVRSNEPFATMCVALIQILLFSAMGATLSYLLTRSGGALWDETFIRWDRALGLDWRAYVELVDSHRWITLPLRFAYASLIPQFVVLILVLGFCSRLAELRAIVFAGILCGAVTVLLSPLFPAVSSHVHLGLSPADFRYIDVRPGYTQLADFNALRNGTMITLRLSELQGIIAFPSYHAGLSMVMLWGFWLTRIGVVRWHGIALAAATIIATPADGGHYFVDVFAAMAVAVVSILIARRAVYWSPAWPRLKASPFRHSHAASAR